MVAGSDKTSGVNPALETLMLAFATGNGLAVPARALFLGAQPHPVMLAWPEVAGWQPLKPLADQWDAAGLPRTDKPPPSASTSPIAGLAGLSIRRGAAPLPVAAALPGQARQVA